MSEPTESVEVHPPAAVVDPGPSAGTLLREARESAGLSLSALAAALKVPEEKLDALETDRWDLLPDAVFARALAGSVCRLLRVDPAPVLKRGPQSATVNPLRDDASLNEPFRPPGDAMRGGLRARLMRPGVLAVGALLLGSVVVFLLPDRPAPAPEPEPEPVATGVVVAPEPMAVASDLAVAAAPTPVSEPLPLPAATAASGALPANTAAAVPSATVVASVPVPAVPSQTASAPAATGGLLAFTASADSWIQVTDAQGAVVVSRMLGAGQSISVSGAVPLSVTVGRADATRVSVRGKAKDLTSIARENVARFEVK